MVAVALRAVKSAPSSFAPPLELALALALALVLASALASASKLEPSVRLAL
jgi:hypothetical protein